MSEVAFLDLEKELQDGLKWLYDVIRKYFFAESDNFSGISISHISASMSILSFFSEGSMAVSASALLVGLNFTRLGSLPSCSATYILNIICKIFVHNFSRLFEEDFLLIGTITVLRGNKKH